MIQYECSCGRVYQFPDEKAGCKVRCGHCGAEGHVPPAVHSRRERPWVAWAAVVACAIAAVAVLWCSALTLTRKEWASPKEVEAVRAELRELRRGVAEIEAVRAGLQGLRNRVTAVEALDARADAVQEVVMAHKFVLLDKKGMVRAMLSTFGEPSEACLSLYASRGKRRVSLFVGGTAGGLILYNARGAKRCALGVSEDDGSAGLEIMDREGTIRMFMKRNGKFSRLALLDGSPRIRAELFLKDGAKSAGLLLRDADGRTRCAVMNSMVHLYDAEANALWQAP